MPRNQPMYRETRKSDSDSIRSEKKDIRKRNAPIQRDKKLYMPESRTSSGSKSTSVRASDVRRAYESASNRRLVGRKVAYSKGVK